MPTIKPLDVQFVLRFAKDMKRIVTVEEHQVTGGLGEAVASVLAQNLPTKMSMVAVQNRFGQSGKAVDLYEEYGLNYKHIMDHVRKTVLG
jgi:transketolase